MVAAAGICAAVVAGALVVANVRSPGQRVTIRPANQGAGPVPGTMFVSNLGPTNSQTGQYAGPGAVTLYPPGASGDAHPEAVITKGIDGPQAMAVDSSGDLWVANSASSTVVEYDRAALATASPAPTVTISGGAQQNIDAPYGLAFDGAGNLWVSNDAAGNFVEFAKADLVKSGAPPPEVKLTQSNPAVDGIVFDASGDLWFGDAGFIDELSKGQLTKSGFVYPKLTIGGHGTISQSGGKSPTFDRAGDLWNGADEYNIVGEYTKAQLAEWGTGTPPVSVDNPWKVVISSAALSSPEAVAFDRSGNLWVPNQGNNKVVEFTKAELTKSGAPAPARTISGSGTGLKDCYAVAFEP